MLMLFEELGYLPAMSVPRNHPHVTKYRNMQAIYIHKNIQNRTKRENIWKRMTELDGNSLSLAAIFEARIEQSSCSSSKSNGTRFRAL